MIMFRFQRIVLLCHDLWDCPGYGSSGYPYNHAFSNLGETKNNIQKPSIGDLNIFSTTNFYFSSISNGLLVSSQMVSLFLLIEIFI